MVIHPGSRYLRIGKASDVTPIAVPNVIARKYKGTILEPEYIENIARPRKGLNVPSADSNGDEYEVTPPTDDPVSNTYHGSFSADSNTNSVVRSKTDFDHSFASRKDAILQASCYAKCDEHRVDI